MVAKSKEPTEADIIANRIRVRHAEKLRLVQSWLPPLTPEEQASAKTREELDREEEDMVAPVPETLGVGATPPKHLEGGILRRKDTSSLEALRKQLLGKNARKPPPKGSLQGAGIQLANRSTKPAVDIDSDEEVGRTAAFTARNQRSQGKAQGRKKKIAELEEFVDPQDDSEDEDAQSKGSCFKSTVPAPSKRKASSFLDEILSEKSKKKKRKKQKNGQDDSKA